MKVALLGASGFVGSRMVERYFLGGLGEIVPIVRSYGSLARLARFDLACRLANAMDAASLTEAFAGCDCVVHAALGHPKEVEGSIRPVYEAAAKAGARRLVYLSTASVHGQEPAPGTDETSPLNDRQEQDYNNRKIRAERLLLAQRKAGQVEVVILRPGIVFGPRDRWVSGIAQDVLGGTAAMVEGGEGICNSIYVDNLVQAIHLATTSSAGDGEAFLVGDAETVRWSEVYRRTAQALGLPVESIRSVPRPIFHKSLRERADHLRSAGLTQSVLPVFPAKLKRAVKGALAAWNEPPLPSEWAEAGPSAPAISREMADLHCCQYKLPSDKAARLLAYRPEVSFEEGFRRTVEWLRFAGLDRRA